jgi:hypothetical protein
MGNEEKVLDQPLDAAQTDVMMLDMVKGLEAFTTLVLREVGGRYPEYPELTEEQEEAMSEEELDNLEPIDDLHRYLREAKTFTTGARQQLEQRLFG